LRRGGEGGALSPIVKRRSQRKKAKAWVRGVHEGEIHGGPPLGGPSFMGEKKKHQTVLSKRRRGPSSNNKVYTGAATSRESAVEL